MQEQTQELMPRVNLLRLLHGCYMICAPPESLRKKRHFFFFFFFFSFFSFFLSFLFFFSFFFFRAFPRRIFQVLLFFWIHIWTPARHWTPL